MMRLSLNWTCLPRALPMDYAPSLICENSIEPYADIFSAYRLLLENSSRSFYYERDRFFMGDSFTAGFCISEERS